uniref:NADH-ubiquinone oxidoreductase chain 3 n=1 Tax=Aglaiogyrodactylus forficulatus TaxID=1853073 RepID=A0A173G4T5_9PLAT|nr:NADH dehydrogenase subunit 3 [Aglaiogyrodactylus forficulatus]ANH20411.1 NADH dehydrogenase subunit 3 [Aglaiogyrodactylus forficulatus]
MGLNLLIIFFFVILIFVFLYFIICSYNDSVWNVNLMGAKSYKVNIECGFLPVNGLSGSSTQMFLLYVLCYVVFDLEISIFLNSPIINDIFLNTLLFSYFVIFLSVALLVEIFVGYIGWDN